MPNLTFMRHGESEANVAGFFAGGIDSNLTDKGREDARKFDNSQQFDVFYVSPLKRTTQTLKEIYPNAEPIIDERITEVSIGDWQGKMKNEVDQHLLDLYRRGQYTPPNAESIQQIHKRACSFVEEIFSKYDNGTNILVVSHNAFIRNLRRIFLNTYDNYVPKNLETITITDEDFQEYLKRKEDQIR